MGDFLTRLGVNFLNHKLKITRGGIEVDNGNISGSSTAVGSFGSVYAATHITASGNITGSSTSTGSFGYLNIAGDTVIGGNLTLGDAATDSISFSAEINSNLIPDADSTYDIGSSSKNWKYGYIEEFSATNITSSNNISASGNIYGSGNLDIDGTSNFAGDATLQSDLNVSGNITGSSVSASSGAFSTINVDGGTVDGTNVTVGSGKTLDVSAGTLTTSAAQKEAIMEGAGADIDIGAYDLRAATITPDGLTSGRVVFAGTAGVLSDDSDLTFSGDTLTATHFVATNITASGNISASGTVYADNFQSVGGDSAGISFADDLNITGNITGSGNLEIAGNVSGSVTSTGSLGYLNVDGQAVIKGMANSNLVNVSSSISTRLSTEETNVDNLQTDSGSFSTRVTRNEASASALTTDSGSFSTRITAATSSISALKTDSGSFSTRVTTNKLSGSILAGTGNIQGLGTTNNVQFNHITASGNISSSGTIYADNFQSVGGDSAGISFADDLNITGHITASKNIKSAGDIISTKTNGVISGSVTSTGSFGYLMVGGTEFSATDISDDTSWSDGTATLISGSVSSTGSFGRIEVGTFSNKSSVAGSSFTGSFSGSFIGQIGARTLHEQSTPATTWSISHGLGTQYVNVTVYDSDDVMVIPTSVTATDASNMSITFSSPVAGTAMLGLGGGTSRNGRTYVHGQSTGAVNWRVTHSLGEQYPAVTVYDEGDNVIIPSKINAVGINNVEITFEDATSGNAHFSVGNGIPGITTANAGKFLRVASNGQNLEFTAANTDVTGALSITGSLTVEGPGHITASGNINSAGDIISTKTNGVISGSVTSTGSFGRLEVVGNSSLTGDLTLGGSITLGDADSDSLTISADLTSNLIPNADSTYDIGSSSKNWRYGYIEQVSATHVTASGNISGSVSSTGSFGAITAAGMSVSNLADVSSSIASRVTTNEGKATKGFTIAMSVAL